MKIVVNNKREKEIIETFTDFLSDWIDSSEMLNLVQRAEYVLEDHELELIQLAFNRCNIQVDGDAKSIYLPSDNIVGFCKYCGEQWQGVEDESELNIMDYEHLLNSDESYHVECHEKQKEENK